MGNIIRKDNRQDMWQNAQVVLGYNSKDSKAVFFPRLLKHDNDLC